MGDKTPDKIRVDKWLWFARFYKTRALATKAVAGGHVRIDGVPAKPSSHVAVGAAISLVRDQLPFELQVTQLPLRRGPAAQARLSYVESESSRARRAEILSSIRTDRLQMPRTAGRPDKHTRRKLRERRRTD